MQICVAVHEHKYGTDMRAFESEEEALRWKTKLAKENWAGEFPGKDAPPDEQIAEEYFRLMGERIGSEESFSCDLLEVQPGSDSEKRPLALPTVHRDGTSREELLRQAQEAGQAVFQARDALAKTAPNARDYYPQGMSAFPAAVREHDRRARMLLEVEEELSRIAEAIADA